MSISLTPTIDREPDWEAMVPVLNRYVDDVHTIQAVEDEIRWMSPFETDALRYRVLGLMPTIIAYADLADPNAAPHQRPFPSRDPQRDLGLDLALKVLGIVNQHINVRKVLATPLELGSLHPDIITAAVRDHWRRGHLRSSVQAAYEVVEHRLQQDLQTPAQGTDLLSAAFSVTPEKSRRTLLLERHNPRPDAMRDANNGANCLGKAIAFLIRNRIIHRHTELSPSVAFEMLAMLSYYARLVSNATVVPTLPTDP